MDRPLRKDALARRHAILKAAAEVLAEQGFDAPLELVAERAGVGRATLYRNFPDRTALALAVFTQEVEALAERTRAQGDGPEVFFWYLDALSDLSLRNAAVTAMLRGVDSPDAMAPMRRALAEAGAEPLRRAQAAGLVRSDLTPADIRVIAALLGSGLVATPDQEKRAIAERVRSIVIDGVKARP